ncbi:hypothetical protein AWM75_06115 [Aerococcus urinaehominis]|uniref:Uncharacterized protein n=1 Tax=Aerococcus urinaehominis TaxID=128944 RepID=A0A109RGN3_9LACT|nr:DNA repair exonuclease [Aerococcus urinaehominis]AMB99580.1 hypothetical protein AWM75_06115 [Aerococcus urinaehominis]SDL86227.1 DNA repair exonuclease SbcCD nuclease subunit [Aerococcus urinaehominis]
MLRFIHAADLHLDQSFQNIQAVNEQIFQDIKYASRDSFNHLIDLAINETVDFVVFAGDIYNGDHASLEAQFLFRQGMDRLNDHNIQAFVIYGNHDFIADPSHRVTLPENVYEFPTEITTIDFTSQQGDRVKLTGFSYPSRWLEDNYAKEYPSRDLDADYHIGLLHGQISTGYEGNRYAPFTLSDLKIKNYDYWALGHIHQQQVVTDHPLAVYPGSIQGHSFKESGSKGVALVTLSPASPAQVEFVETSDWQFVNVDHQLPQVDNLDALRDAIERNMHQELMRAREGGVNRLVRLTFHSDGDSESLYWWLNYADQLLDQLQWSLSNQVDQSQSRAYLVDLDLEITPDAKWASSQLFGESLQMQLNEFQNPSYFDDQLQALLTHADWQRYMAPLVNHDQFMDDVISKAESLIVANQANYDQEKRGLN